MKGDRIRTVLFFGPYIITLIGFFFRAVEIGTLAPFIDEAAYILTGIDPITREAINPISQGRPLLAVLFRPALLLWQSFPANCSLIEISRFYVSLAVSLTTVLLIPIGRRIGGEAGAWVVALVWTLCPLSFLHGRIALQDPISAFFFAIACGYIYLRPKRLAQQEGFGEICWLLLSATALALAVLNKITALFELPWLAAAYVCEQSTRKEGILVGHFTRIFSVLFFVALAVLSLVMIVLSIEKMAEFGHASSHGNPIKILLGGFVGASALKGHLELYAGKSFQILVAGCLFLCPLLRHQTSLFVLSLIVTFGVYCFGFGNLFYGRYLCTSLIPVTLLVVHSMRGVTQIVPSSVFSRKWLRNLGSFFFFGTLSLSLFGWSRDIYSVLSDPIQNTFTKGYESIKGNSRSTDYEQYTSVLWTGFRAEELADFFRAKLSEDGNKRLTVIGSPDYATEVYATRLFMFSEERVAILEGDRERWDFPFFIAYNQRLAGDRASDVYWAELAICSTSEPIPCPMPIVSPPGVALSLEKEILRGASPSRYRVLRASVIEDLSLKKLTPKNKGRYPDGLVAPLIEESISIGNKNSPQEKRRIVITGSKLPTIDLNEKKLAVFVNGESVEFVFEQSAEKFQIALKEVLMTGSHDIKVFFGSWLMSIDPFTRSSAFKYRNIQRAVTARDVHFSFQESG